MLFTWDEWVEIAQIQANYRYGWKRYDPDLQPRYIYRDGAIERAKHLAGLIPHRPFRVVEVEVEL